MSRVLPVRTCVGCRERATKSDLLRIVAVGDDSPRAVVPDERGRTPGRGAHLHPSPRCLDQAERRRAITRALRLDGPADISALRSWVETHCPSPPGG
ncbi:MAG: YlxR family protein [Nocardioidaceae bacterium]|nr:YlxR family protein [Nocardioidaceae bacterium]